MGNLVSVWTGVPDDDEQSFSIEFSRKFNQPWEQVLVSSEKAYVYFQFWDACFAVNNLKLVQDMTIADLPVIAFGCTKQLRCNIIVG